MDINGEDDTSLFTVNLRKDSHILKDKRRVEKEHEVFD